MLTGYRPAQTPRHTNNIPNLRSVPPNRIAPARPAKHGNTNRKLAIHRLPRSDIPPNKHTPEHLTGPVDPRMKILQFIRRKPRRQPDRNNRTQRHTRHRRTIAQTNRHRLIPRRLNTNLRQIEMNPVKQHISCNKNATPRPDINLRHIVTDTDRKILPRTGKLPRKPRRNGILSAHHRSFKTCFQNSTCPAVCFNPPEPSVIY